MEKKINDGGPAFPAVGTSNTPNGPAYVWNEGMSLRDHLAGLAMQALIAKTPLVDDKGEHGIQLAGAEKAQWMRDIALSAYDYADHMVAARSTP